MREKEIEKYLVSEVRKRGGRAYKWVSPGNAGVPDRIVILPGMPVVFAELKSERGRLTELQKVQIGRLKELGQEVRVLYGREGVEKFLERCGKDGI
ncbi:VRR-NUC domain-containing protein [Mediterraneibacter sp. NSJ-55]|uniref:VRR-NUC domain-containing protein n=1 Tax=Mediterraneibacter hominis TaxID=2763054 RepID=A0A923LJ75_9FIRM|nr:VRR-NUC domain-containing protein [Mediterraneibacter hominis]MBC5689755.1 VRR-NUC domain-containing protein [Mediterraneibacter hominis]